MTTTKRTAANKAASKTAAKATAKKRGAPVAKKAAKKSTTKKATPKRTTKTTKNSATKKGKSSQNNGWPLVQAKSGEAFWVTNGEVINNLMELRDAFSRMDEEVFAYHATNGKNDFAEWVEAVLKDSDCAAALRRVRKPGTARGVVVKHLKFYSS